MKRMNFPGRKDKRRDDALLRQIAAAGRTRGDQLDRLVAKGHGHCAEARELRS